jgi:hypothetical protein
MQVEVKEVEVKEVEVEAKVKVKNAYVIKD